MELLELLDEDQRSTLMSQYRNKTAKQKQRLVNFTADSFKKYDSVKIANFVDTLLAHNLKAEVFAQEI